MKTSVNLEVHPAALLFPLMGEEELGKLADDIAANGLMEPVVLYHGQILDGRNRLAACELGGVQPRFCEVDGDLPSPTIYVLSKNLHRRHLSTSQRAAIAADMVPLLEEEAHKRQGKRNDLIENRQDTTSVPNGTNVGRSAQIAADAVKVSRRTVHRAVKVKKENPEAHERVKRGEITVTEALGEEEQRERNRGNSPTVYEPKTDHQKKLAEGQKERMVRALSQITGLCRGLLEMDVRKAVSACDDEERTTWIERSKELSSQLTYGAMTDEQLALRYEVHREVVDSYLYPKVSPSGLRTRRSELCKSGDVEACGEGRTASGRKCTIWRLK